MAGSHICAATSRRVAAALIAVVAVVSLGVSEAQAQRALGLDVSAWQSSISQTTWNNLRNVDDRDFVFIRSSRGGTTGYYNQNDADNSDGQNTLSQRYDDPYFVQNITRATNAGMLAGSYHYSRPDIIESTKNSGGIANSGADEADHFIQMAGAWMRPGYLMPVHDLEAGDGVRSDNAMAQFTLDFSDRIYDVMGVRPALYVNGNYAAFVIGGASSSLRNAVVAKHPTLWSARWPDGSGNVFTGNVQTEHPKDSYSQIYGPWDDSGVTHPWTFWQYSSGERLSSFGGRLDANVAQGGIEFVKDRLVPALWMNDSSGEWTTLANWNSGQEPIVPVAGRGQVPRVGSLTLPTPRLPGTDDTLRNVSGANDTVILDRPGASITVTHSSGTHNIRKLYAKEALNITGGSLNVNYVPSADSTPIAAQFSAPVSLTGGSLSVHTLQVDALQTLTLGGGALAFNKINLMPGSTGAKIALTGDVELNPLAGAAATIARGSGAGSSGVVDLTGGNRKFTLGDGAAEVDLTISAALTNGGLTKDGAGTLALTGPNSYGGDTAVLDGTLRLAGPTLANTGDVLLNGGTLELSFSGMDLIGSLFIDGASQLAGTWGAVGSGADFTSPFITGTGLLQVSSYIEPLTGDFNLDGAVDGQDLDIWQQHVGTAAGAGREQGDANGDGAVDGADFLAWQRNQGAAQVPAAPSAAAAIPEPATLVLLAAAMAGLATGRRC